MSAITEQHCGSRNREHSFDVHLAGAIMTSSGHFKDEEPDDPAPLEGFAIWRRPRIGICTDRVVAK
jgi:hypothetical protein